MLIAAYVNGKYRLFRCQKVSLGKNIAFLTDVGGFRGQSPLGEGVGGNVVPLRGRRPSLLPIIFT